MLDVRRQDVFSQPFALLEEAVDGGQVAQTDRRFDPGLHQRDPAAGCEALHISFHALSLHDIECLAPETDDVVRSHALDAPGQVDGQDLALACATVLGGSFAAVLGAFAVENALLGLLGVMVAPGALFLLLPRRYTWRAVVLLWTVTLGIEAVVAGSAIAVYFLIEDVYAQLGLYACSVTLIATVALGVGRKRRWQWP